MFNKTRPRCQINLSKEGVSNAHQQFDNKLMRNAKESKDKICKVCKKHTAIFNNKGRDSTKNCSNRGLQK